MSKSTFKLSDFTSEVLSKSGLARTNRFEVEILKPVGLSDNESATRLVSLYVDQAVFPPLVLNVKPFKIFGPSHQRPITSEYGGEGLNITFHVDRDMKIRRFFENWLEIVVNPKRFTVGYLNDYSTTIHIKQLDEQNNVTHDIEVFKAFPRSMNIMELNNSSTNQTHKLNVVFAYHYWQPASKNKANDTDVPLPVRRPGIPTRDVRLPQGDAVPFDNRTFIGTQDEYGNITDITGP